jgi:hypothetical protein
MNSAFGILTDKNLIEKKCFNLDDFLLVGVGTEKQKSLRDNVANIYSNLGYNIYRTPDIPWIQDSFIMNNGLIIPQEYFGELAHGGRYLFGTDFVLISSDIQDELDKKITDDSRFKQFFSGLNIYYVDNYNRNFPETRMNYDSFREETINHYAKITHIDLTIGLIPQSKTLTIDKVHYDSISDFVQNLTEKENLDVIINEDNVESGYHPFTNNHYSLTNKKDGEVVTIINGYNSVQIIHLLINLNKII